MAITHVAILWLPVAVFVAGCNGGSDVSASGSIPAKAAKQTAARSQSSVKRPIVLATTTSTHDTGLLERLIPLFSARTGYQVKTVAVGTGQALELGRRGEADVLLVHAPAREKAFVTDGHGKNRRAVMHNGFVIVGPATDPAGITGSRDAASALRALAEKRAKWASRADGSGTNTKEHELWRVAGATPADGQLLETGQGMGATLRITSEKQAYTLADRGTFIATAGLALVVLVEGDERLFNPYHVIEVVGPKVNAKGAAALGKFFVEPVAQQAIHDFRFHDQQLFVPDGLE